ncbi:hypothetical protein JD969_01410 [Planctomycetota bacterium]|nr:hypothetical protein JD969_01410 [Planctomycetota bacterium]
MRAKHNTIILLILTIITAVAFVIYFTSINKTPKTKSSTPKTQNEHYVSGPFSTGKPCSPNGFEKITPGMSYDQITSIVGKPTADIGSGLHIHLYEISTGGSIQLTYSNLDSLYSIRGTYTTTQGKEVTIQKVILIPDEALSKIYINMPLDRVEKILGEPSKISGSGRLFYHYQTAPKGEVKLFIANGKIAGITSNYQNAAGKEISLNTQNKTTTQSHNATSHSQPESDQSKP